MAKVRVWQETIEVKVSCPAHIAAQVAAATVAALQRNAQVQLPHYQHDYHLSLPNVEQVSLSNERHNTYYLER